MDNIRLLQIQFVVFFKDQEKRPDRLGSKIDEALNVFDQIPTNIPVPEGAPPEIPVVIMQSSNQKYKCNLSKLRVDFAINYGNSSNSMSVQLDEFFQNVDVLSDLTFQERDISRFGIVSQYFVKSSNPIRDLNNKYLKQDFSNSNELTIRFNQREDIENLTLNNIVDISKATANQNGVEINGLLIQRDINNIPLNGLELDEFKIVLNSIKDKFKLSSISILV